MIIRFGDRRIDDHSLNATPGNTKVTQGMTRKPVQKDLQ